MKTTKIFELHKIDTGYVISTETKTLAFHDNTVIDERMKMFNEMIKLLEFKHDLAVVSRRTDEA